MKNYNSLLNDKGMTLIEIMMAVAIMGIALVFMTQMTDTSSRIMNENADQVCMMEYEAGEREKRILNYPHDLPLTLSYGTGCEVCMKTGYKGRIGVFEIMEVGKELRLLIDKRVSTDELRRTAIKYGMVSLWEDVRQKVMSGITTLEEMVRVTYTT